MARTLESIKVDTEWYNRRLKGAMACVFIAFSVLGFRLFYLQIIQGKELRRLSENNRIRLQTLDAPRGLIFDRKRRLLVHNRPSFDLSIIQKDAESIDQTIEKLFRYSGILKEELIKNMVLRHGLLAYKPILLKQDISRNAFATIEAHKYDLPGISVNIKPKRQYIYQKSAAHLLGYMSEISPMELKSERNHGSRPGDFIGKFGVEKTYQDYLMGKSGGRQVEVDANGRIVRILKTVASEPGHNIILTLDIRLQKKAEALLEDLAGAVVAMNPNTGDVLTLASSPNFDQNIFADGLSHEQWDKLISNPQRPMENKAIQGEYPPASTFKIVTAIAGIEEGVIDENKEFFCPGYYKFGDRVFHCWKKGGHGSVNVVDALSQSCDVFFYQVGQKLGVDRLAWYASACGLGAKTGIALSHEKEGLIPTAAWKKQYLGAAWQKGETLSIAIGQGYTLTTPLQMAILMAAVANGGIRKKPILLKQIETVEGEVVKTGKNVRIGVLPASRQTLAIVKKGLFDVVNSRRGTAWIVHVKGLDICGKTGTAQIVSHSTKDIDTNRTLSYSLKPHAWFIAYAPVDEPKIAVAILVEHGEHGSSAAGPIARELIKTYLFE